MVTNILIWTCLALFIITSAITVLGIINKIQINKKYLDKLFIVLILEIAVIGVSVFKGSFSNPESDDFVKITMPVNGYKHDPNGQFSLQVTGAYQKSKESVLEFTAETNGESHKLSSDNKQSDMFTITVPDEIIKNQDEVLIRVNIISDGQVTAADSVLVKIGNL